MRTDVSRQSAWTIRSPADLSRAIAGIREQRNLTQRELAEAASLDRSYLARLEAGGTTLAVERILRALRRMGATVTITLPEDDGEQD